MTEKEMFTVRRKVHEQLNTAYFGRLVSEVENVSVHDGKMYADVSITDKESQLEGFLNSSVLSDIVALDCVIGIHNGVLNVVIDKP